MRIDCPIVRKLEAQRILRASARAFTIDDATNPIKMARIAITTSSSTSVKAAALRNISSPLGSKLSRLIDGPLDGRPPGRHLLGAPPLTAIIALDSRCHHRYNFTGALAHLKNILHELRLAARSLKPQPLCIAKH